MLTLGEVVRCDFSAYPNVQRRVANMKRPKSWDEVNEALCGLAETVRERTFETV